MGITKQKRRPQNKNKPSAAARVQGGTHFSRGQQRTRRKGKKYLHTTKTNWGASTPAWFEGGTRLGQWRIRRWRVIRARFWKSVSRYIAFSAFFTPIIFSLTDCWYIQRWSTSCLTFWDLIESRVLVTFGAILPSIRMIVLLFIQRVFPVLERFMMTKWIGFVSLAAGIECEQKMLMELKQGLCREKSLGRKWFMRIMAPWRFIKFY